MFHWQCLSYSARVLIESDWNLKQINEEWANRHMMVLIESDWNLKSLPYLPHLMTEIVLIESDWNLKYKYNVADSTEDWILIESDWNLKVIETEEPPVVVASINRIRLEFKVYTHTYV